MGRLGLRHGGVLPQLYENLGVAYAQVVSRRRLLVEPSEVAEVNSDGHWVALGSLNVLDPIPQS